MKKVYLFTLSVIFYCFPLALIAQMQYTETKAYLNANAYWAWHNNIGIDWSTGVPIYDSNRINSLDTTWYNSPGIYSTSHEGLAVAASSPHTGQLRFYAGTIGPWGSDDRHYVRKIVNGSHQLMPNTDSLLGNSSNSGSSQGQCIVPMPDDSTKYYVFSIGRRNVTETYQLYYQIVDLTLGGGSGDITPTGKNIPLDSILRIHEDQSTFTLNFTTTGIIAIPGNNCDVWLLTQAKKIDKNDRSQFDAAYYIYHINSNGINPTPLIFAKKTVDDFNSFVLAPNREWILGIQTYPYAPTYTGPFHSFYGSYPPSELIRFDAETGSIVSSKSFAFIRENARDTVIEDYFNIVTAAFSPDNSKIYTINSNILGTQTYLTQYDLSDMDSSAIAESQTVLDSFGHTQFPPTGLLCMDAYIPSLRLYNDTIFMPWGNMNKISSINKPNEAGAACEYQLDYFSLPISKLSSGGRGFNEVVYPQFLENFLALDTNTCKEQTLMPRINNPGANYKWNNGETTPTITVSSGNLHWVTYSILKNNCVHIYTDTFKINWGGVNPPPQITVRVDTLSTAWEYTTYQWLYEGVILPGETNRNLTVSQNGEYQVIVTNQEGCIDTSEIYTVTNRTNITSLAPINKVSVYPNPTTGVVNIQSKEFVNYQIMDIIGRELSTVQKGNVLDLSDFSPGTYQLIVFDKSNRRLGTFKISKL